jgi:RNA polymerase sigma-70 factor (ECF subfamily)
LKDCPKAEKEVMNGTLQCKLAIVFKPVTQMHSRCRTSLQVKQQVIAVVDDIVGAAQAGSPAAFEELYATYSGRLYKTILSITRDPHDAEEALQDTFLRAHLAIKRFKGRSTVYTWLTRIAINSALMILRKQRARPEVLFAFRLDDLSEAIALEVKDSAPNPEELCVQRQHQLKTLNAIRRLRPNLQAPIRMQLLDGWSVKEISRALNISEAAVKSRLCRARKQLSTSRGGLAAYIKTGRARSAPLG